MKGLFNKFQNDINRKKNRGVGQSLGGTKPGKTIPISIPLPGPIGAGVENTKDGKAIISNVTSGSQAENVGLQRGDAVCFADTNGSEEMPYRLFLDMAKSDVRPFVFEVRRVDSSVSNASRTSNSKKPMRADDEARRQAVIAAAEARDKHNKQKKKPIRKATELSASDKKRIDDRRERLAIKNETYISNVPLSEEAQRAAEAAKKGEVEHTEQLGYNPYASVKGTGKQASAAVTDINHGSMKSSEESGRANHTTSKDSKKGTKKEPVPEGPINPAFDDALTILVTMNQSNEQVKKSLRIMRKLIMNASATVDNADNSKNRVRISNANKHIQAAVNDANGALDLMFSVGFLMSEDDADYETYLVYSPEDAKTWLPLALDRMEQYESSI